MTTDNNKIATNTHDEYNRDFYSEICMLLRDLAAYIRNPPTSPRTRTFAIDDSAIDVAAIRRRLRLSQAAFSRTFGLDVRALQKWEKGTRVPDRAAHTLLCVIEHNPEAVKAALARG